MRLLVTGGSGFLGGYVLAGALRWGHECVALARSREAAAVVTARGATPLVGDLDDGAALAGIFAGARCDALVNLASLGFGHDTAIVGAAVRAGLDRAVFVSTTAVTTALPVRSKAVRLAAEAEIRSSGLKWTILRPTMIYGTVDDRNLSRLLGLLARLRHAPVPDGGPALVPDGVLAPGGVLQPGGVPMSVPGRVAAPDGVPAPDGSPARRCVPLVLPVPGGGHRLQQPVHVADVAEAVLAAVERPETAGRCYDVAGPEPLTFAELLRVSAAAVGCRVHLVPVPLAPVVALTRAYERISRRPRIRAEQWERLAEDKAFPIDAAARDLAYAPRSFDEGIRAEAAALGLTPVLPGIPALPGSRTSDGPVIAGNCHRRRTRGGPCLASPRARWPPFLASACRCAARPGCCSIPTPGRSTSREGPSP